MSCEPSRLRLYYNEFPRRPPRRVLDAARRSLSDANRYPDEALARQLKSLMASYAGVDSSNVHAASGGEYVFYEAFSRIVRPGDPVVLLEPTFTSYEPILRTLGAQVRKFRLRESGDRWTLDLAGLADEAKRSKAKLVVVDDPNNPTGSPVVADRAADLVGQLPGFLLLDEAYHEFAGYSSAPLVRQASNLLVFRTMSKAFAMAGMRVSFLIGPKSFIEAVEGFSPRFELSRPSMAAAVEALRDPSYAMANAKYVSEERERLYSRLASLKGLRPYRSVTNFVLMRFASEGTERKLPLKLMIPSFSPGFARISVGSRREDDCALDALKSALGEGPSSRPKVVREN